MAGGGGAAARRGTALSPEGRRSVPWLLARRLASQQILSPRLRTPADLVRWFGAVQAQDRGGSLWAIGLRLPEASAAGVEEAVEARAIVRTWPMRGTLHWVPAEDARWMLRLLAPRVMARGAPRHRQLGLDEAAFTRARRILVAALQGGRRLERREAYAALERGGVSPAGQRGIHVLAHLAQQGVVCLGPRAGKQPTFVLLEEWIRRHRDPDRDEALATLAVRYYRSHGPATVQDFAWWTGLPAAHARSAVEAARADLRCEARNGVEWWSADAAPPRGTRAGAALLPPWDEYVVAYKTREALFGRVPGRAPRLPYAVGHSLAVVDGFVSGTWKRTVSRGELRVDLDAWAPIGAAGKAALAAQAARHARFTGQEPARVALRTSR